MVISGPLQQKRQVIIVLKQKLRGSNEQAKKV